MRVVAFEFKILELEIKDAFDFAIDDEARRLARGAGELGFHLLHMVGIDMRVAHGVNELPRFIARHMGEHFQQQRVGSDVEGHAEEHIGGALVELQVHGAVLDADLPERVTGGERHVIDLSRVPGRDDQSAAVGVVFDLLDEVRDLVGGAAGLREAAPLVAIDGAKVAVFVGPFVPNADAVVFEVFDIGVTIEEPQEFVNDGFEVQLFGGDKREAFAQVIAALHAEVRNRPRSGAIIAWNALFHHGFECVEVFLHRCPLPVGSTGGCG